MRTLNDHTTRPVVDMEWEIFTFLAHGGMPLFVDTPNDDGTLDRLAYKRMAQVFKDVKKREAYFGFESVKEVGLYFSLKSRDWYGKDDPLRYLEAYVGAHKAVVESHRQVSTVFDENVTLERLKEFPVIYLANTAILDAKECDFIRQYVREGGNLLATYETSRFDVNGQEQKDYALADVLGVNYQGKTEFKGNYFSLVEGPLNQDIEPEGDFFIAGPNNVVSPAGGTAYGELKIAFHDRGPDTAIGHAPHNSAWKAVGPAVVVKQFGKGKVVYFPFSPEMAYLDEYTLPEHRLLIGNALRYLYPNPPVSVKTSVNVESVVRWDGQNSRYLIHFIPYIGVRDVLATRDRKISVPPIQESFWHRTQVSLALPVKSARALSPRSRVNTNGNTVHLETDEIHEVLVVQC